MVIELGVSGNAGEAFDNALMKVLDLECGYGHRFEGWFGSETDFLNQVARDMVECPVCASAAITKRPSAPRLNLGSASAEGSGDQGPVSSAGTDQTVQAAWMALARRIVASTDDVGSDFPEEARKIHYGETKKRRGIRGQASPAETQALREEGIEVMPLPLPEVLKGPLQ